MQVQAGPRGLPLLGAGVHQEAVPVPGQSGGGGARGEAGQTDGVALGERTHSGASHLLPTPLDLDLAGREDDGESHQGVPGLGGLEVHPAPVLPGVLRLHCLDLQLGGVRVDLKPGPAPEAPGFLLTPLFGCQKVGSSGVVGVDGLPVVVLVPKDREELLPWVLNLDLTGKVGGEPEQPNFT